jgi:TRAP-type C4-dicarboxylate transport system permease small subunit
MIKKIIHYSNYVEAAGICVLFAVLLVLMMFQIVTRYVFSFSLAWVEQLCRLLFVYISLLGMSYAAMKYQHLRVSALAVFSKNMTGKVILLVGDIICSVFSLFLAYRILLLTSGVYRSGQGFAAMPAVPIWVMYAAGVLGMFGLSVRTFQFGVIPGVRALKPPTKENPAQEGII